MFERMMKTIDCHTHLIEGIPAIACLEGMERRWNHDSCCVLSLEGAGPGYQAQNALCMAFKRRYPRMYAFCGLNHAMGGFEGQARALWAMGCDGFKMIEGKPDTWKRWGIRLDDPVYDGFYSFCQEQGAPLLLHTADPDEFWDLSRISKIDLDCGWYYDHTFPTKEELTRQAVSVMEKHPGLKLILAHFFFLADDFPRLGAMLDRFPCMYVDITPGAPPYEHFSRDTAATRAFFTRYRDRILYGTDSRDMHNDADRAYMDSVVDMVGRFLETSDDMVLWDLKIKGAQLPEEVRRMICSENFLRIAPHREMDDGAAGAYFRGMLDDGRLGLSAEERQTVFELWG